ncbi:btk-binding protein-related [Anaeramoeba flamelloides]|uniref:Btk-binding protein-related n=1 Tax=Anaeramoeba flamelloides TaxID=1746091 RepID=A0AAV7YBD3_9EUKA|nr:btk-binding protein-related [Anaeramoeba flamelloides]
MKSVYYCYSFGNNSYGQCGYKKVKHTEGRYNSSDFEAHLLVDLDYEIDHVIALKTQTMIVTKKGSIIKIGKNGKKVFQMGEEKVVSASGGKGHCLFLMLSGNLYGYGSNSFGQLGSFRPQYLPQVGKINTFNQMSLEIIKVVCSRSASFFLCKNGDLYACGSNKYGEIGMRSNSAKQVTPIKVHIKYVRDVFSGPTSNYVIALTVDNKLYIWGDTSNLFFDTRGENFVSYQSFPLLYNFRVSNTIKTIACGKREFNVLFENGKYSNSNGMGNKHTTVVKWISASKNDFFYLLQDNEVQVKMGLKAKLPLVKPMHNIRIVAGHSTFFVYTYNQLSVLAIDLLQLFQKKIMTDCELNGIKCHKALLEIRIGASFGNFPEILKNYSKEETSEFLSWVYSDYTSNFDLVEKIINKLQSSQKININPLSHDLLKLLKSPKTSDFALIVDNVEIPIHRFVLCARSELFHKTFKLHNSKKKVPDFSGKSLESIKILIHYFYTEKLILNEKKFDIIYPELEDAMEYYHINKVSDYLHQLEMERQRIELIKKENGEKIQEKIEKEKILQKPNSKKSRRRNKKKKKKKKRRKKEQRLDLEHGQKN